MLSTVLLALGLGAFSGAALAAERDPDAAPIDVRLHLEVESDPVVGQVVPWRVEITYDDVWLQERAVRLVARAMDVPIDVQIPWLVSPPGAEITVQAVAGAGTLETVVNGALRRCRLEVARDQLPRLVLRGTFRGTRAGAVTLLPVRVRYAQAERFQEDLLGERVAVGRTDHAARSEAKTLTLVLPPTEGQPASFDGAVGTFAIDCAPLPPTDDTRPGALRVRMRVAGTGNLDALPGPTPGRIVGFHTLGIVDEGVDATQQPVRSWVVEVQPLGTGARAFPALPFAFLVPGAVPRYREVWSTPFDLPAGVRAMGATLPHGDSPPAEGAGSGHVVVWCLAALLAALGLAWLLRRVFLGQRRAQVSRRVDAQRKAAVAAYANASEAERAEALAGVLRAYLGGAAHRVASLEADLQGAGATPEQARDWVAAHRRFTRSRYGSA